MIKLRDLLWEVGEGSSEPFEYNQMATDTPGSFKYNINAEAHGKNLLIRLNGYTEDWYSFSSAMTEQDIVNIEKELNLPVSDPAINDFTAMYIEFGIPTKNKFNKNANNRQGIDSPLINDKVYMFRLMATIKQILVPIIDKEKINLVYYNPAKRDTEQGAASTDVGRSRLYDIFIRSSFPGAKSINSTNTARPNVLTLIRPISK